MSGCFEWPCIFKFNVHGHKKHLPSCSWAQQIFFTSKRGNSILKTCIYVYSQHWYLQWRTIIHSELSIKSDMEQHDVAVFQIGWISVLKQPVVCDLMRLFASRSLWQLLASYLLFLLCLHSESHNQDNHNRNIQNYNKDSANNNNKCDILQVGNKTISGI